MDYLVSLNYRIVLLDNNPDERDLDVKNKNRNNYQENDSLISDCYN